MIAVQDSDELQYGRMAIGWSVDSLIATMGGPMEKITQPVKLNNWYHVVLTRNATDVKMYLDGSLILSASPGYITSVTYTYVNLIFGVNRHRSRGYFMGSIDDIRIYNRAISQSEVTSLFQP